MRVGQQQIHGYNHETRVNQARHSRSHLLPVIVEAKRLPLALPLAMQNVLNAPVTSFRWFNIKQSVINRESNPGKTFSLKGNILQDSNPYETSRREMARLTMLPYLSQALSMKVDTLMGSMAPTPLSFTWVVNNPINIQLNCAQESIIPAISLRPPPLSRLTHSNIPTKTTIHYPPPHLHVINVIWIGYPVLSPSSHVGRCWRAIPPKSERVLTF